MIDAGKFARPILSAGGKTTFRFDLCEPKAAAATLREFADAIESGRAALLSVQSGRIAKPDDYSIEAILFEFASREDVAT